MRENALMKKIILISLLLIILAVGGFTVYVSQMDWNTQKERLSAQLSEITGKKIQFSGDLQVKLFPHPRLSAVDVQILNPQTGDKLATIKNLQTEVSLSSLLHRKPDIQSLSLEGMEAWFVFDKNGKSNWKQKSQSDSFSVEGALNLHNFNVQKSVLHFNHKKYDIAFDLTSFNADIQVSDLNGPYRLDGSFLKDNNRYGLALNIDSLSQLEGIGTSIVITHPDSESNLRYDGIYNASENSINGDFSGQSQKTADFINSIFNQKLVRDEYNLPLMFSTALKLSDKEDKISNLVIKFDKLLEGAGDIVLSADEKNKRKDVNIKYQLVKLNLVPFMDLFKEYFHEYQNGKKYEPDFDFNVNYDVSAERLNISEEALGVWENVSAKGAWKDSIFSIDDFYAGCPGNITLSLKANLEEKDSEPYYYSEFKIDGQNALSFINSLGIKVKSPRQGSYRDINLNFYLHGNPQVLSVENIDLKMDKAEIEGFVTVDLAKDEYVIEAKADVLNLDNYILWETPEESASFEEKWGSFTRKLSWLQNNKIIFNIAAENATLNGISARDVVLDFASDGNGNIIVENASLGNLLGADVELSALIKNWGRNNPVFDEVVFDIKSSNIKMLADKLQIELPKWTLFERSKIEESGVLLGNLQKIYVNSLTKSGEHSLRYDGILNREKSITEFSGNVNFKTNNTENLLKLVDEDVSGKTYRGTLTANAEISGNVNEWKFKNADIQMGKDKYTADITINRDKKEYKISGDVHTEYLNLLNWINVQKTKSIPKFSSGEDDTFIAKPNFSGDVINYNGYRNWAMDINLQADKSSYGTYLMNDLKTHILNGQNVLRFQDLNFENKKQKVSGELSINYAQTPQMSGNLSVSYPQIKNLGSSMYSLSADNVVINTEFETSAVTVADMVNGLKGKMLISGNMLVVKGINLSAIREDLQNREYSKGLYKVIKDNTQSGETIFNDFKLDLAINNALFTFEPTTLENEYSKVNISGNVNLKEWKINSILKISYPDLTEIPGYSLSFSGMLNKPVIDTDISEIVNKYDKHWKEIEQERIKQQELQKQQHEKKVSDAINKVDEAENDITVVLQKLEERKSEFLTDDFAGKYRELMKQVSEMPPMLEDIKSKLNEEAADEQIAESLRKVEEFQQQINSAQTKVDDLIREDVEHKRQELSERELNVYNRVKEAHKKFLNTWKKEREQLGIYDSYAEIDNNEELNKKYYKMQENKNSADKIHEEAGKLYAKFLSPQDGNDRKSIMGVINELIQKENELLMQMQLYHQQSVDMMTKIISDKRMTYEKQQRKVEKERQLQAQQDAQNLLISDNPNPVISGADTTVPAEPANDNVTPATTMSFDENKKVESVPKVEKEEKQSGIKGKIITSYERDKKPDKETSVSSGKLLTPITGDVAKVSGSIKVK